MSAIVEFLRSKVSDPMQRIAPFIWVGYPRSIDITYPLVAVTPTGGTSSPMSIGITGDRYLNTYQIDIYVDTDTNTTIGGRIYAQYELCTYIATLIKDALKNNKCEFLNTGTNVDARLTAPRLVPYDEVLDQYRMIMVFTVQLNDPVS
jgi:hypothetical protein